MSATVVTTPASAHHSFARYDQAHTKTLTGKLKRYVAGASHAQFIFEVLDADGKPVIGKDGKRVEWVAETGPAASVARRGVSKATFPEGTIITVKLYPLRDGRPFGALAAELINCGRSMPSGGCTRETGEVLILENN